MAGSVGKLEEQQPWLGMTAIIGRKKQQRNAASHEAAAPSPDDDRRRYEEGKYDDE